MGLEPGEAYEGETMDVVADHFAGWTPTPEKINALPPALKRYICHLETNADPALTLAENIIARDTIAALGAKVADLQAAMKAARHQLVAAFGIIRSNASPEHVQHYQRAMMMCDSVLDAERLTDAALAESKHAT